MAKSHPRDNLSKTPSWITLGFVLGILAVLGFQHEMRDGDEAPVEIQPVKQPAARPPEPQPAPESESRSNVSTLESAPSLSVLEAVFEEWGQYAVWEDDRTQVAFWNSSTGGFTDLFEVVRTGSSYFFRSIDRLTRPLTEASPPSESPLRFTETEAAQRARREGRLNPQSGSAPTETGPWRTPPPDTSNLRPDYLPPRPPASNQPKV